MEFCNRLASLRENRGISQKDFANELGFEPSKYNKWERGTNRPDFETVCKIANHLGVSTDFLLGNSDQKHPENQLIAENLGLSDENIAMIKKLNSCSNFKRLDPEDKRRLIDVFNIFMGSSCSKICQFFSYVQYLTEPKNFLIWTSSVGWENEDSRPFVHIPDKKDLDGVVNPSTSDFQKEAEIVYTKEALHKTLDKIIKAICESTVKELRQNLGVTNAPDKDNP